MAEKTASSAVDVGGFEWPSPEVTECPFPFYRALREAGPVCRIPGHDHGEYLVSRWDDIAYVEEHPEIFSIVVPGLVSVPEARIERFADEPLTPWAMPSTDPPEHKLKRSPTLSMVHRDSLQAYEPRIRATAHELIDSFIDRGTVDFYAEFAEILPLRVIMDIMDLPLEDFALCKRVSNILGVAQVFADEENLAGGMTIDDEGHAYMAKHVLDRHREPRDDFISRMVAAQVQRDGALALGYLSAQAYNMLFAGNITTTHMLGSAMLLLVEHPAEMQRVRSDRKLLRPMLEEVLRLETPVQFIWRHALVNCVVGGVAIPAGAKLALLLASGNRDERRFNDPDRFWVGRPRVIKDQLAFGRGIHLCVGKPLARLEGEIAFDVLLDRIGDIHLAEPLAKIRHIDNPSFRAPASLVLQFRAAAR